MFFNYLVYYKKVLQSNPSDYEDNEFEDDFEDDDLEDVEENNN